MQSNEDVGDTVKSSKFRKKLYVSGISKKQNLANTVKSYAMSNLHTKYKILQKVKIFQQKQIARGMNVNQKSSTLTQCLNVFDKKKHLVVLFICVLSVYRHG